MVSLKAPLVYRLGTEPRTGFGLMLRKGDFMIDKGDHKGAVYDVSKSGKDSESKYDIWLDECGLSRSMMNPSGTKDLLGWTYQYNDDVSPKMYATRLGIIEMINGYLKEHCCKFGFYLSRSPMVWNSDSLSILVEVVPGDGIVVDEEYMEIFEDSLSEFSNHVLNIYKSSIFRLGGGVLSIDFRVVNLLNLCAKYPGWSESRDKIMEGVEESSLYQSLPKLQKGVLAKSAKSVSSDFMSLNFDGVNFNANPVETKSDQSEVPVSSDKSDQSVKSDMSEVSVNSVNSDNSDKSDLSESESVSEEAIDQISYDNQFGAMVNDIHFVGINLTARGVVSVMLMSSLWPVPWVLNQMLVDMLVKTMKHREVLSDFEDKLSKVSSNREFGLLHNEIRNVSSINVRSKNPSNSSSTSTFTSKSMNESKDLFNKSNKSDKINKSTKSVNSKVNTILRQGGYRGYRIVVKGPLDGARRTLNTTLRGGILPLSSVSVGVAHSRNVAATKIGTRGVTVTYAY